MRYRAEIKSYLINSGNATEKNKELQFICDKQIVDSIILIYEKLLKKKKK